MIFYQSNNSINDLITISAPAAFNSSSENDDVKPITSILADLAAFIPFIESSITTHSPTFKFITFAVCKNKSGFGFPLETSSVEKI